MQITYLLSRHFTAWVSFSPGERISAVFRLWMKDVVYTGWSNILCLPDDYNTENYKYWAQSDCLAADRQGQGYTRLTLMPSVIPNSNYVVMASDWNHWRTQRGGLGVQTPPPEIIPKFWQSQAEFPVPWKIDLKNLIRIRVSPRCKLGGTPDWGVTAPDPCSLCPLSSTEFVELPEKKIGYATAPS
jgi:hypothetical protein